jgi:hypothetical protein
MTSDHGTLGLDWWCGSDKATWAAPDAPIVLFIHGINGMDHAEVFSSMDSAPTGAELVESSSTSRWLMQGVGRARPAVQQPACTPVALTQQVWAHWQHCAPASPLTSPIL